MICAGLLTCSVAGCATVHESPLEVNLLATPPCYRDEVYPIFVASPIDVCDLGGMERLAEYAKSRGCANTQFFVLYDDGDAEVLADRIRAIRCRNPRARILLTGFSSGCLIIHDALCLLEPQCIAVDRVCYIDSFTLKLFMRDPHPNNVGCVSLVYREKNPPPTDIPRSSVYYLKTTNHFETPTDPRTVHVVMSNLCQLAGCCY